MEDINKKFIIISILLVLIIGVIFICNKDTEKVQLDEVRLKDVKEENSMFAIMVQEETNSENYILYEEETWPTEGYTFNSEKSGCLDSEGKKISDVQLNYAEGKVKVETDATSYCYIYFDVKEIKDSLYKLCKEYSNIGECIKIEANNTGDILNLKNNKKGDLDYRYVGSTGVSNNYICFGTFDETTCTASNGKNNYIYRIIGVDTNGRLKLIKYTSIGTHMWNNKYIIPSECPSGQCTWDKSSMYQYLNTETNGFYANSSNTYVPEEWKTKIDQNTWNMGDVGDGNYTNASMVLTAEKAGSTFTGTDTNKIGLMYLSDYYYAYSDGEGIKNCKTGSCTSWLTDTSNATWTMTRYGGSGYYSAWFVNTNGAIASNGLSVTEAVRPVFYLTSDVTITKGEGTLNSPYIIN